MVIIRHQKPASLKSISVCPVQSRAWPLAAVSTLDGSGQHRDMLTEALALMVQIRPSYIIDSSP